MKEIRRISYCVKTDVGWIVHVLRRDDSALCSTQRAENQATCLLDKIFRLETSRYPRPRWLRICSRRISFSNEKVNRRAVCFFSLNYIMITLFARQYSSFYQLDAKLKFYLSTSIVVLLNTSLECGDLFRLCFNTDTSDIFEEKPVNHRRLKSIQKKTIQISTYLQVYPRRGSEILSLSLSLLFHRRQRERERRRVSAKVDTGKSNREKKRDKTRCNILLFSLKHK